ncbi:MAG TPA: carboxypeptidase-like regulatory domain-containing protein, partial [Chitinophagales bacterium]|nr:carboxypeptidase-like regulatory domain-containing protein [Chitinophagales bacterium]
MRSLFIKFQLFCLLQFILIAGNAQSITGNITDATTREILPGVNITIADHGGVSSDENGNYNLQLPPGKYVLNFSFLGYETKQITVVLGKDDIRQLPVILEPASQLLDPIVVSGSLFEKKQSEETISMVIADQRLLEHTNTTNLSDAITKVPGVYMMDEQANIRGGTG